MVVLVETFGVEILEFLHLMELHILLLEDG
jgi:hypothetical protein